MTDTTTDCSAEQGFFHAFKDRFWSKVVKTDNCWLWSGSVFQSRGYGQVWIPGIKTPQRAHRVSWIINNGPIPDGMCVLHRCDCRLCVRPDHLWIGTQRENIDDMVKKGRSQRGENSHRSKLTNADVIEIREMWHTGLYTQLAIADYFGIRQPQVSEIVRRTSWSHIG